MNILLVGAGGAVGAVMRYLISLIPYKGAFPLLTLITNLLGAVIIGFISGIAEKKLSPRAVLFLKTGVCGGFTTFSTFSLEAYELLSSGKTALAAVYSGLSVVLCIAGAFLGTVIARKFVKI